MSEAKPIAVIYFPNDFSFHESGVSINPNNLMRELNGWDNDGGIRPRKDFEDYIWFCFTKEGIATPEFQVFHNKDFTPADYESLKALIEKHCTQTNVNP